MTKNKSGFKWFTKFYSEEKSAAIVFPDKSSLGYSNLAVHVLFRILNRYFLTDIFFSDTDRGILTGKRLNEFDYVFFTVSYEPLYPNIVKILLENNIEPLRDKRTYPLLIGGGIAVSSNPYPLLPFFDILAIGEAEVILPQLVEALKNNDLNSLERIAWAVIPGRKVSAQRVFLRDLTLSQAFSVFTSTESTFKMFLYEISRSCPQKCRFCLLSHSTLPPRYVPLNAILKNIPSFNFRDTPLGLVGSSILDHPEIEGIIEEVGRKFKRVTVSSLKINPEKFEVLKILKAHGLKTVTIAPEAGTYELRRKINKDIKDEDIREFIKIVNELRFETLKMYFIIGLPEEEKEDVKSINEILEFAYRAFSGKIQVTVSIFVPKPHTPFQYRPFPRRAEIRKKIKLIKPPPKVTLHFGSYQGALNQTIFSRGNESLGYAILQSFKERKPFKYFIDTEKILFDEQLAKKLPFNLINTGVNPDFLENEDRKAKEGKITPPCDPGSGCRMCGVCKT